VQFELENDSAREADSDIDEDMMNEMTEDMISMASQLKHNTQLMADLVKGDNKVYHHQQTIVFNIFQTDHRRDSWITSRRRCKTRC